MTDADIRLIMKPWWQQRHPDSLLIHEYGRLGDAIADFSAFRVGRFCTYEIKSDHDSLRRLPGQLNAYATFFHEVTIIVGPRYLVKVQALAPAWMGIVLVDGQGEVVVVRPAGENPTPPLTARALWIEEGRHLCRQHGLKGYSRLTSWTMPDFLHQHLPAAIIEGWVMECIRHRYKRAESENT